MNNLFMTKLEAARNALNDLMEEFEAQAGVPVLANPTMIRVSALEYELQTYVADPSKPWVELQAPDDDEMASMYTIPPHFRHLTRAEELHEVLSGR
jgi:hypothetical protein